MTWNNMALVKAMETISKKGKAGREGDERAQMKEAEHKEQSEFECAANAAESGHKHAQIEVEHK
jgi:hypothetical protein